ncbi:GNAT family N-acetyltransferase [Parvibaculum sp.]|uniref:GNAT family N-acetyltransferase n=1 Tax=Parvibaculum sp. TaxID=2024848 RepID=UPI000C899A32|nr:GNAT family N-acetyltransferase [Parvibaculum sp.]MAB13728.1 hypothetical protein [Parvibaculum sp.]
MSKPNESSAGALQPGFGVSPRPVARRGAPVAAGMAQRIAHASGINVYSSFAQAEKAWREMEAEAAGTAFQSFDWLSIWHEHVGQHEGIEPAIMLISRGGHPVMLAPFGIERHLGLSRLVWLGGKLADYKAPLIARDFWTLLPEGGFPVLWKQMKRALPAFDYIVFENQPAMLGELRNPFAVLPGAEAPDEAYLFDLPDSFEELTHRYRAETRRMDRSKLRKLEAQGEVTFEFAESQDELVEMTEEILMRKADQLAAQGISSIFQDPAHRAAWRALAALPEERRLLEVAVLRLDGEFLSGSISHVWHDRSTLMVHTYEMGKHSKLSPGRLHLLKHLQSSIDRGLTVYDLSVGYLPYKASFCDEPMRMVNHIASASLQGMVPVLAINGGLAAKRRIKRNPKVFGTLRKLRAAVKGK